MAYLALTLLIEIPVLFLITRVWYRVSEQELPTRFLLIGGFCASTLTYSYLWFLLPVLIEDYVQRHIFGEILIVGSEAVILHGTLRLPFPRSFWASFFCNGTSIAIGVILNHLVRSFHWFS